MVPNKANRVRRIKSNLVIRFSQYNLTTLDKSFGQIIRDARESVDLTQDELAGLATISKSYVGHIENMRPHSQSGALPKPNRDKLIRVIRALNSKLPAHAKLDTNGLLKMVGHAPAEEEEFTENGFYSGLKRLSPERQLLAKRQIKAIIEALAEEENPDTDYIDDEEPHE